MDFLFGLQHLERFDGSKLIVFDCETTGLRPKFGGLRLLQLASPDVELPVVIDCWAISDDDWIRLEEFFAVERIYVAHNAVFDLGWLQEHEIYPAGKVRCSMLASRVLTNGMPNLQHRLSALAQRYLKVELDKEEQKSDWSGELRPAQLEYAAKDVVILLQLYNVLRDRLAYGRLTKAWLLECDALPAMASLWRNGLPFNRKALLQLKDELVQDHKRLGDKFIVDLDAALPEDSKLPRLEDGSINLNAKASGRGAAKVLAGFNLNSPKQLLAVFTALLGEEPVDANGKASASRQSLRDYAADHAVVSLYLDWKRVEKRRQMVESLLSHQDPDGFVRASYMQAGADTFRMSCNSPNLQQVPRDPRFRACVQASAGWKLVVADYAQMELRLAAAEAEDPLMIRAFQDGIDLHTLTAMQIYGVAENEVTKEQRQVSKSANFGLLYGSGAKGLRNYAGMMGIQMTHEEAGEIRDKFHAAYTGIHRWQQEAANTANKTKGQRGEVRIRVSDLRRFLPGDQNRLTTRCNTPIQGAGAAVLKRTLAKLWPLLQADGPEIVKLSAVVHDEVVLLVREDHAETWAQQLAGVMQDAEAEWLKDVPALAEAKVGNTWAEAK
jgi:DNA polymerase I-like protein with 3'-5' exonuclease and polymerase domains